jgi:hypothetical protein
MSAVNFTYTITFGDQGENHVGMQKIGVEAKKGISCEELKVIAKSFESLGCKTEITELKCKVDDDFVEVPEASLFVARNCISKLMKGVTTDDLLREQQGIKYDTKALMRGRVVNKKARHNVCFDEEGQEADFEEGKGTIVAWRDVPLLKALKKRLQELIGEKTKSLVGEGNFYYDVTKTMLGYHGDSERRIVVALRLGHEFPLFYQWYHRFEPVGKRIDFLLNSGDIYIMSEKAVGTDWKRSSIYTLRHSAGYEEVLKKNAPKKKEEKSVESKKGKEEKVVKKTEKESPKKEEKKTVKVEKKKTSNK